MTYVFDIDGTLSDLTHRLPFIQRDEPDWDSFFMACIHDKPLPDVITLCQLICETGNDIVLITGRSSVCESQTTEWLSRHSIPYRKMYMRKHGDHRRDDVVKSELLDSLLAEPLGKNIAGVFEDRKQVVDMYRKRGLRVYQVAPGDF